MKKRTLPGDESTPAAKRSRAAAQQAAWQQQQPASQQQQACQLRPKQAPKSKAAPPSKAAPKSKAAPTAPLPAPPTSPASLAGHSFLVKAFGTHNVPGRSAWDPATTMEAKLGVAGSQEAILLDAGGEWHLFEHKGRAKHTGTNLGAQQRLVHENTERVKALFRSFVYQLKQRRRSGRHRIHTLAVFCEHGKHRSVAFSELLKNLLVEMGGAAEIEHISKHHWSRKGCGWDDCDLRDISKHTAERRALNRTALPWLQELL